MPSRAELELRAAAVNVDANAYPNDSKLEQKVFFEEKAMTAKTGTGTTRKPSDAAIRGISGERNV